MKKQIIASGLVIVTTASIMAGCSTLNKAEKSVNLAESTNPVETVNPIQPVERIETVGQYRDWAKTISFEDIVSQAPVWKNFVKDTKAHKERKVSIGNGYSSINLEYANNMYHYRDGAEHKEYKYLQELKGTIPNASCESHFVILTNKRYSFKEISLSTYSNDSEKAFIDYQLIYCY